MAPKWTKTKNKTLIAYLTGRLPSERTKTHCIGCFAPRNTITVKSHIEKMWLKGDIVTVDSGVMVFCVYCGENRFLSLSSFSLDVFLADLQDPNVGFFMLLKDDKFNSLIGGEINEELKEVIKSQGGEKTE